MPDGRNPGVGGCPPTVYLASPLGFTEPGRYWAAEVLHPALAGAGWEVLDPWVDETGDIAAALALPPGPQRLDALRAMSRAIGERNRRLLDRADAVLAVLDGADVDSGTAAEIGWASARGCPVIGLRTDFRLSEHEAAPINVQVEDFVRLSGGRLVPTLPAALDALAALDHHSRTTGGPGGQGAPGA